jgi:hypothetical protein
MRFAQEMIERPDGPTLDDLAAIGSAIEAWQERKPSPGDPAPGDRCLHPGTTRPAAAA